MYDVSEADSFERRLIGCVSERCRIVWSLGLLKIVKLILGLVTVSIHVAEHLPWERILSLLLLCLLLVCSISILFLVWTGHGSEAFLAKLIHAGRLPDIWVAKEGVDVRVAVEWLGGTRLVAFRANHHAVWHTVQKVGKLLLLLLSSLILYEQPGFGLRVYIESQLLWDDYEECKDTICTRLWDISHFVPVCHNSSWKHAH